MQPKRISLAVVALLFALTACRSGDQAEHRIPDKVAAGAAVYVVNFDGL